MSDAQSLSGEKTPLTPEGQKQLSEELERLKNKERPEVVRAIAEARAHGDLSENAEYHAAKDKQGMLEARIKRLDAVLGSCEVIDPAALDLDGRCVFGAYVRLADEDGGEREYRVVGEMEADVDRGRLSNRSPMGRALIGKYPGDVAEVQTPGGVREYEVLSVRYRADDKEKK